MRISSFGWLSCFTLLACTSDQAPLGGASSLAGSDQDAALQDDQSTALESSTGSAGGAGGNAASSEGGTAAPDTGSVSSEGGIIVPGCKAARNPAPKLPGSRDPDLLARAATVVGSCMPDDGIDRNLANMWHADVNHTWVWERTGLQAECLAAAQCGCDAVKSCIGWEVTYADAGGCQSCSGSVYTLCGTGEEAGLRLTMDCSSIGLTCDPLAACTDEPATACTSATFVPTCDAAGRPETCQKKFDHEAVSHGPECGKLGVTCAGGQCVGSGAACTGGRPGSEGQVSPQGLGCSGAMLDACIGGKHQTLDCAQRGPGFSCQSFGGGFFCGLASECLPGNEPVGLPNRNNSCEGNSVVMCNAGRIDRVDCLSLGFTGCAVNPSKSQYGCIPGPTL